jgi:hypothetical protein
MWRRVSDGLPVRWHSHPPERPEQQCPR